MSLWDKIKNAGRSDEYDEYEDDYEREDEVEEEASSSRARSFRRRAASVDTEDDTPSENGSGRVMNVTTPTQLQVVLVKPTEFEDSIEIANSLKSMHTVVLNLESTNKDVARRILDFLSGVAYANDGQIKKVANCTFIITPYNVGLMGDLLDELENNGLYF